MRAILLISLFLCVESLKAQTIQIGSKKFTESVILGEVARLTLSSDGFPAIHREELGGTRILWNALLSGDIDVYVDYTGTLSEEILQTPVKDFEDLKEKLKKFGVGVLEPLGFNNTYAIGMTRPLAEKLRIRKISDLAKHTSLRYGFGEEFRLRRDGWLGLKEKYNLPHGIVRGLDHDIAYRALASGDIHVTDFYSTDAEIEYYDLVVLDDSLGFFPKYEALYLFRLDRDGSEPSYIESLRRLSGKISDKTMIAMNKRAKIDKVPSGQIASEFLQQTFGLKMGYQSISRFERVVLRSKEHLKLVLLSLTCAILFAIPLGILAHKFPRIGRSIIWLVGMIQTIPALALLVVLIQPLNSLGLSGIGDTPALIALFLYSLLPIVRGTHLGFEQIPNHLREAAATLGLGLRTRLFQIEIPLALPSILSGLKVAAVMSIGFATLGALVGAGGYGQPILTGIRLDDYGLILEGALPSALLALIAQQGFDFLEDRLVSPGLK